MPPTLLMMVVTAIVGAASDTAAESVTLRDGTVILGQFVEGHPVGPRPRMLVRRAWAEAHMPALSRRWAEAERLSAPRATRERIRRLEDWIRDRPDRAGDPIRGWIESELLRLRAPLEPSRLLMVTIDSRDVDHVGVRSSDIDRMLRQAWRAGFEDAETMPLDRLRDRLEGRGVAIGPVDPAPVSHLLGLPVENETQWRLRRAATEIKLDSGLRFLRYHRLIWPEETAGEPADAAGVLGLIDDLFNQDVNEDPLPARLRQVAGRGDIGALVTSLEIAPDFSVVRVEIAIWLRFEKDRWLSYKSFPVAIQTAAVDEHEAAPLANDPRVQAVFKMVESLGLGGATDDARRSSLRVGAATRQALGLAQLALRQEIETLALPIGR